MLLVVNNFLPFIFLLSIIFCTHVVVFTQVKTFKAMIGLLCTMC